MDSIEKTVINFGRRQKNPVLFPARVYLSLENYPFLITHDVQPKATYYLLSQTRMSPYLKSQSINGNYTNRNLWKYPSNCTMLSLLHVHQENFLSEYQNTTNTFQNSHGFNTLIALTSWHMIYSLTYAIYLKKKNNKFGANLLHCWH